EAFAHDLVLDLLGEGGIDRFLPGRPAALDELDDAHLHAMAERAADHAEGGGRLALALPRVDDQQALLPCLVRHHPGLRRLPLAGLFLVAGIDLVFGHLILRARTRLARRPRWMARRF